MLYPALIQAGGHQLLNLWITNMGWSRNCIAMMILTGRCLSMNFFHVEGRQAE
jgi:hypothetical protein